MKRDRPLPSADCSSELGVIMLLAKENGYRRKSYVHRGAIEVRPTVPERLLRHVPNPDDQRGDLSVARTRSQNRGRGFLHVLGGDGGFGVDSADVARKKGA